MNITTAKGKTQHSQIRGAVDRAKCGLLLVGSHAARSKADKAKPVCKRCASKS